MTHQQWEAIERALAGLSNRDKRELLVQRLLQSLRTEPPRADRARQQREALERLCQGLDALPTAEHGDGLTNRDHDRLIYAR